MRAGVPRPRAAPVTAVHRFHHPDLPPATAGEVELPADEARHLTRVLRIPAGARVRVFDGRGREWDATVTRIDRRRVVVRLGAEIPARPEPAVRITLAVTRLKGRKLDAAVRDATMLGVSTIVPLETSHDARGRAAGGAPAAIGRWRAVAVASAKQCGRAVVPSIGAPVDYPAFVRAQAASDAPCLFFVEPAVEGLATTSLRALAAAARPAAATIVVGPEGGWSDAEIQAAHDAGFVMATLGARTLRAEAVPIVVLSILQFVWSDD